MILSTLNEMKNAVEKIFSFIFQNTTHQKLIPLVNSISNYSFKPKIINHHLKTTSYFLITIKENRTNIPEKKITTNKREK